MQKSSRHNRSSGFTLVELLLVILIIGVVSTIVIYNLPAERSAQVLNNNEDDVISLLNEARSRTLSGEAGKQYGVHLEAGRIVLFGGTSFADGAVDNKEIDFDREVTLSSISLAGSGSDVLFKKLSGDTDQYGSVTLSSSESATQKIITISKTGLVSGN